MPSFSFATPPSRIDVNITSLKLLEIHATPKSDAHFAAHPGYTGRLRVLGLRGATLRFFPPAGFRETVELVRTTNWWEEMGEDVVAPAWEETPDGPCAVWRDVTGPVFIAW